MRMPSKMGAIWKKYPLTGFLYADEAFSSSLMVKWVTHCVLRNADEGLRRGISS
jgi:hypothetical protein